MTVNKLTDTIKPLDEVNKINEIIDELGNVSTDLASLNDTTISNPANNPTLLYNSSTSKWVNANGFDLGTVSATVDSNVGTPSVTLTKGGTYSATTLSFAFSNIKGETGQTGATGSSGVYVGSTQPTDPDINVWIDTSASAVSYSYNSLSNITNAGKIVIAHNSAPSAVYEDVTLTTSGTSYTAPADGYYCLDCGANNNSDYFVMTNTTSGMTTGSVVGEGGSYFPGAILPVSAGDEVEVVHTFSSYDRVRQFRFYYANGSTSLHVSS